MKTNAEPTKRPPFKCLVIQLARMGDTLQSLMALRAAKQLYPELEIHFVARESFASAIKRVPWISSVTVLPTAKFLGPQTESLGELARWIAPLVKHRWDLVLNWSFSESSSYLTALLPARIKLGYTRRPDLSIAVVDGWSHFMQAIVQGGIDQNIHLTDVLTTQLLTALQIHIGDPADAGNEPVTSRAFFSLELQPERFGAGWKDHSRKWLGIQIGSGRSKREWDADHWADVAAHVLRRHPDYSVVLMGASQDKPAADRFNARIKQAELAETRVISMVGQTDFDLWATVVGRCQWVLSSESAVIHLASILGTRVLEVAVGDSRHRETGPYGNGHYVVQPVPGESLSGDAVYGVWAYASSEWLHRRQVQIEAHFSRLGWSAELDKFQVSRSRIRSTQDGGGVVYEPLIERPLQLEDWSSQVIGSLARAWYCGWLPPIGSELKREMVSPKLVSLLRELEESTTVLGKICVEGVRTAKALEQKTSQLRSERLMPVQEKQELSELAAKLGEIDILLERMGKTHAPLEAFARMAKVLMHNLSGDSPIELGREGAIAFDQLGQGTSLFRDWVKHTLKLAKPVALASVSRAKPAQAQQPSPEASS